MPTKKKEKKATKVVTKKCKHIYLHSHVKGWHCPYCGKLKDQ